VSVDCLGPAKAAISNAGSCVEVSNSWQYVHYRDGNAWECWRCEERFRLDRTSMIFMRFRLTLQTIVDRPGITYAPTL
jgi:hypothetical protein